VLPNKIDFAQNYALAGRRIKKEQSEKEKPIMTKEFQYEEILITKGPVTAKLLIPIIYPDN
jgi:hypothetical protein